MTEETERWLNIYKMNGLEAVTHGFSTGVRGGATNVPDFSVCANGTFPCEERFDEFYTSCADSSGRFYQENLECIMCNAWKMGDREGEFSYNPNQWGRQWQAVAAMQVHYPLSSIHFVCIPCLLLLLPYCSLSL